MLNEGERMMNKEKKHLLVCFSSFKDTLSAVQVGQITLSTMDSLLNGGQEVVGTNLPLSDGGEGFLHSLRKVEAFQLSIETFAIIPPHEHWTVFDDRETIDCPFGINYDKKFAIVEMALACGIEMIPVAHRNPMLTTTHGLGQLLRYLIDVKKVHKILLGIGGSATSDAGIGALQALGFEMFVNITDFGFLCFFSLQNIRLF